MPYTKVWIKKIPTAYRADDSCLWLACYEYHTQKGFIKQGFLKYATYKSARSVIKQWQAGIMGTYSEIIESYVNENNFCVGIFLKTGNVY